MIRKQPLITYKCFDLLNSVYANNNKYDNVHYLSKRLTK